MKEHPASRLIGWLLPAGGLLLAILVTAVLIVSLPSRHAAAVDDEEAQFLVLINSYRAQNGAGPLTPQSQLTAASEWMANDMATDDYFSHYDNESPPRDPAQRDRDYGWNGSPIGENIAAGYATAQQAFDAWRASPGHNAAMLSSSFNVIGIGRAYNPDSMFQWYWVTDFSYGSGQPVDTPTTQPASATPTPTTTPTSTPTPSPSPTVPPTPPPTPTPSPTPDPTPTPSPSPSPTPAGGPRLWGDVDCSGEVTIGDAQKLSRVLVGLPIDQQPDCPSVSQPITADGYQEAWGDVDCNGALNISDGQKIARVLASLEIVQNPHCFVVASAVWVI